MPEFINHNIREIIENSEKFISGILKDTTKKNVYHYTSDVALKSILENSKLRLSDINFLNDESEMKYFYKLAENYLESNIKSTFHKKLENIIIKDMKYNFESEIQKNDYIRRTKHFVISFSLNSDCLPLWVYYTKNPNSIGYNIRFNKLALTEILRKSNDYGCIAGKVIYSQKYQEKILKEIFQFYQDLYDKTDINYKYNVPFLAASAIKILSLFCKSQYFKNEEEYRIVIKNKQIKTNKEKIGFDIKFKIDKGLFIPYIETDFKEYKSCIEGINISPTQNNILAERGLKELLKEYEYNNVDITKSDIPLRY